MYDYPQLKKDIDNTGVGILELSNTTHADIKEFFNKNSIKNLITRSGTLFLNTTIGMVGETEDDIMMTIDFAKELNATENAFSILTPYPDSPLWHTALQLGQVDEYMDFDRFLYYNSIGCNLSATPTDRLMELHKLAYSTVKSTTYTLHTEQEEREKLEQLTIDKVSTSIHLEQQ